MPHRKCAICGKDIVLVPSAAERAHKTGESPKYYIELFTSHGKCQVEQRNRDVRALIKRKYA